MIEKPDLMLTNAAVYAPGSDCHRSAWIIVKKGCIAGFGKKKPPTLSDLPACRVIDCRGASVLPGFVDAHIHLAALAKRSLAVVVTPEQGIHSIADLQQAIADKADNTPPGEWIRAEGYHEFDLLEKRHPHRKDLDEAAPAHPIKLTHRSGHAHALNTRAMDIVGIRDDTGDPPGGLIDRDLGTGLPSGLLFEMGRYLADRIPSLSDRMLTEGIERVNAMLLANGVTTVCDASASNSIEHLERVATWAGSGRLSVRTRAVIGIDTFLADPASLESNKFADSNTMAPCGVKIIVDETTGRLHPDQRILNQWVAMVHRQGGQVVIHAIEETAIAAAIQAIETAVGNHPRLDHRHRIEHCAVCPAELIDRIAASGIRVVSQPGFLFFNGDRYLETVAKDNQSWLYSFKALSDRGIRVAAGSDAPVAPASPLSAMAAAVNRMSKGGRPVNPMEAVNLQTAVAMHTINSAGALYMDGNIGSLAMGKKADMVILDRNIENLPSNDLHNVNVQATIIDGNVVHEYKTGKAPAINR